MRTKHLLMKNKAAHNFLTVLLISVLVIGIAGCQGKITSTVAPSTQTPDITKNNPSSATQPATIPTKIRTVGVLIFPGFEVLDVYGPIELWGNLPEQVQVVVIAAKPGIIASSQGPKTVAEYGYDDAPPLDLILVPGGMGILNIQNDPATLEWLRLRAKKAEVVMSVCNGASLLAAAGILDDRPATTNKMLWEMATKSGPKVKWVKQARWVDDGNVVTSSGVSAGIDMSLAVIGRLYGSGVAERLENITEYEPHRNSSWDPFAK